jgi:5-methylthioadenosine/S-adenosylhomocysteine deaminase
VTRLRIEADVVLTMNPSRELHSPGQVVIEGDRILAVGPRSSGPLPKGTQRLSLGGHLVMPGLVNAHTHSPMVLFRGLAEGHSLLTFEGWYNAIRTWEGVMDAAMVRPAVLVSCAEMMRTGTTTFADQYFFMDEIVPAVRSTGMRAALAYGIVEMGDKQARERELAIAAEFLESVQAEDRITGWVGPHALFVDNSAEAIRMELQLADRYRTGLHIHLATSGEEDRYCQEHFGRSAVAQMKEIGILQRQLLAAHCITIPQEDYQALAESPFTAVIAASAAMKSGAPAPPLAGMRAAGINTALGTDNVTNNNSYDLFCEMDTLGKLMSLRERNPGVIPTDQIVEMATLGGARALGMEDLIGSLEPGKKADLISLDFGGIGWAPLEGQDIYTALVYAVTGMQVRDTMVDGRWLLRESRWQTIDFQEARSALDAAHLRLRKRAKS